MHNKCPKCHKVAYFVVGYSYIKVKIIPRPKKGYKTDEVCIDFCECDECGAMWEARYHLQSIRELKGAAAIKENYA